MFLNETIINNVENKKHKKILLLLESFIWNDLKNLEKGKVKIT